MSEQTVVGVILGGVLAALVALPACAAPAEGPA